jgi:predicted MFS family arabinose efflux permease
VSEKVAVNAEDMPSPLPVEQKPWITIIAVGFTQIFAWGATYYLLTVLAEPIAADTGWSKVWVIGGYSVSLLVAGLISPYVGSVIQLYGGRPVLAASSAILALGLAGLAVSSNLAVYMISWIILGLGMGSGLYDAAFATLGRAYGTAARHSITAVTLIAGFSSTICWPLSAYLLEQWGWRGVCLFYSTLHVVISLPIHLLLLPTSPLDSSRAANTKPNTPSREGNKFDLYLLALALTSIAVISAIVSVYLIVLLEASGAARATAVALAALLGPSQVVARLAEMFFGRYYHPIWTLVVATSLMAAGLGLLAVNMLPLGIGVVLYGGGIGIAWVARGTLPLALFGPRDYAALMGRLGFPSLLAQAISPSLGAIMLNAFGAGAILTALFTVAILTVAAVVWLKAGTRH